LALTLQIDRDWTWDGLAPVSFEIFRSKQFKSDTEIDDNDGKPIGDWEVIHRCRCRRCARTERKPHDADLSRRRRAEVIADAGCRSDANTLPGHHVLDYHVEKRVFRSAPAQADVPEAMHLELPVTTPPAQVPRITAAAFAMSKYERDEIYSQTGARRRFLWLELEEPPRDPNDEVFVRMLGVWRRPAIVRQPSRDVRSRRRNQRSRSTPS
jgi:hypothetical protein